MANQKTSALNFVGFFIAVAFVSTGCSKQLAPLHRGEQSLENRAYSNFIRHSYSEAERLDKLVLAKESNSSAPSISKAETYVNLGRIKLASGLSHEAAASFQNAIDVYRKFIAQNKAESGECAVLLSEALCMLARSYRQGEDTQRSLDAYDQALSVCDSQISAERIDSIKCEIRSVHDESHGRPLADKGDLLVASAFDGDDLAYAKTLRAARAKACTPDERLVTLAAGARQIPDQRASESETLKKAVYLSQIGTTFEVMNRPKEARAAFEKCYALRSRILWPSHPDLTDTACKLGCIDVRLLDFQNAAPLFISCVEAGVRDLPKQAQFSAAWLANQSAVWLAARNVGAAKKCAEQAVALCKQTSEAEPIVLVCAYTALGNVFGPGNLDVPDDVEKYHRKALALEQEPGSKAEDKVPETLHVLAFNDVRSHKYDRARCELQQCIGLLTQKYGPKDERLANVWITMGELDFCLPLPERAKAASSFKNAVDIILASKNRSLQKPLLEAYTQLSRYYSEFGDKVQADDFARKAARVRSELQEHKAS